MRTPKESQLALRFFFWYSAGSYISANDKRLHFGLGTAREARVEVRWPSGQRQALEHVAADQVLTIKEP